MYQRSRLIDGHWIYRTYPPSSVCLLKRQSRTSRAPSRFAFCCAATYFHQQVALMRRAQRNMQLLRLMRLNTPTSNVVSEGPEYSYRTQTVSREEETEDECDSLRDFRWRMNPRAIVELNGLIFPSRPSGLNILIHSTP